ncbi:MAG TPA: 2-oxo acid dehydrogenase subunit E2 [Steroidobacteraceae bacterium]|jgi:pyruvate dehydrogenase E2 component (dihydrolipoamide acetyltransferase)|nr:2-oxo acid dehydrogenase subunit E2 [Steroidobacteraceae bacterium]
MNAAARLVEVRVPDMGNFKDVAVIDVLVKPGESIEPEAPLVTLETEKATMDVPSTASGVIEKLHVEKGGKVNAGDLIATLRPAAEAAHGGGPTPPAEAPVQASAAPAAAAQSAAPPSAAPSTTAASAAPAPAGKPQAAAAAPSAPAQSAGAGGPASAQAAAGTTALPAALRTDLPPINEPGFSRAHAGPSVRKLARELGVDLTSVGGHGFKGRITHDDVKAFVKAQLTSPGAAARSGGGALPGIPAVDFSAFGPIETQPLSRIQRISGPRLHASWVNIPHVTQFDEADITALEALRGKLKDSAGQRGIKLTPLAFIIRACVKALQAFPQFNASLDPTGANLILKKYLNIGFAADTPNGLMVPVVQEADRKDIYEVARQLGDLSEAARGGKLTAAQMQGGCFTISSLGGIGGTAFTPIINAPEVAILGVSRSTMKPVYQDGTFVPRLMLPLSLSYDHRVIDGATAVRFTTFLAKMLAEPHALIEAVP